MVFGGWWSFRHVAHFPLPNLDSYGRDMCLKWQGEKTKLFETWPLDPIPHPKQRFIAGKLIKMDKNGGFPLALGV